MAQDQPAAQLPAPDRRPPLRYRLLAVLLLVPFIMLGVATLRVAGLRGPHARIVASRLSHGDLIGIDSSGRSYLSRMDQQHCSVLALDPAGRQLWEFPTAQLFEVDFGPSPARLQEQADGLIVLRIDNGLLFALDREGGLAWKFNPYSELPREELQCPMPPELVPPFTLWHDGNSRLFALDYGGRLLWCIEAWREGLEEDFYGVRDSFGDGELLVTVRRPATPADSGTGDYILRRVLRNGSHADLWRIDVHGDHGPPVPCADFVLSYDVAGWRGLCRYRQGREYRGVGVLPPGAWQVSGDSMAIMTTSGTLKSLAADGAVRWEHEMYLQAPRLVMDRSGRSYCLGWSSPRLPAHAPLLLRSLFARLRSGLGMDDSGNCSLLSCFDRNGELLWDQQFERPERFGRMFLSGNWLAIESNGRLRLWELPPAADA